MLENTASACDIEPATRGPFGSELAGVASGLRVCYCLLRLPFFFSDFPKKLLKTGSCMCRLANAKVVVTANPLQILNQWTKPHNWSKFQLPSSQRGNISALHSVQVTGKFPVNTFVRMSIFTDDSANSIAVTGFASGLQMQSASMQPVHSTLQMQPFTNAT